jgi:hypothetical protein
MTPEDVVVYGIALAFVAVLIAAGFLAYKASGRTFDTAFDVLKDDE